MTPEFPAEVRHLAFILRQRGLGYARISERLREKFRPAPNYATVKQWCVEAGIVKGRRP